MRDSAVTLFGIMVPQSGAPSCDTMMVAWPVLASMISNSTVMECAEISVVKKSSRMTRWYLDILSTSLFVSSGSWLRLSISG